MAKSEDGKTIFQNFNTKERSVNFSKEEVLKLQKLVNKYKHILMCKKTDGTSAKQKDQAWSKIETDFNSTGEIPRTLKQLKYKFENMKRIAKKEAAKERQEIIKTGGGQKPSLTPGSEEGVDWLRSVMSATIDGNQSLYDDDIISSPILISVPDDDQDIVIADDMQLLPEPKVTKVEPEITARNFDCSTPHSSLKKPISAPLRRQILKKTAAGDNSIKKAVRERKMTVIEELTDIEKEKIKNSIDQQKELHQQIMRHNEEKHKLELIKLQLEIEILQRNNLASSVV